MDLSLGQQHLPILYLRVAPEATRVLGAEQVVHLAEDGETARRGVEVLRPPNVHSMVRAEALRVERSRRAPGADGELRRTVGDRVDLEVRGSVGPSRVPEASHAEPPRLVRGVERPV